MKKPNSILKNIIIFNFLLLILLGIYSQTFNAPEKTPVKEVVYSELLQKMDENKEKKMTIAETADGIIRLQVEKEEKIYVTQVPKENKIDEYAEKYKVDYKRVPEGKTFAQAFSSFFTVMIIIFIIIFIISLLAGKKQGPMGNAQTMMKANAKKAEIPNVKMTEIGGLSPETKREVYSMIESFKSGEEAKKYGIRPVKGAILYGPPGTGKTLLAKAVANEMGANFYSMSGSSFTEMFVGVGAGRVRELYAEARKNAPSLIFIDEVDAFAGKRSGMGRNDERESTLNEFLTQQDGMQANEQVMVLVATNRLDMLDDAFVRAGRFDLKIMMDLPDLEGRKEIIKIHTKTKPLSKAVLAKIDTLANETFGYSGAEIEGLFLTAATNAFNLKKPEIDMDDINYAIDRNLLGSSGRKLTREDTKLRVAYHEAGHALLAVLAKEGSVRKATISPRGQALGFVSQTPDELNLSTYSELVKRVQMILAGGLGEMVKFKEHSVGVGGDVQQAKQLIEQMVDLGMGDGDFVLTFNDKNKEEKMQKIFYEALEGCKKVLKEHKEQHEALTQALLLKETLDGKEIEDIVYGRTPEEEVEEVVVEVLEESPKENIPVIDMPLKKEIKQNPKTSEV